MKKINLNSAIAPLLVCAAALLTTPAQAQSNLVQVEIDSTDREAVNNPELADLLSNRFKVVGRSYQVRNVNGGKERGSVAATRPYYAFPLAQAQGQTKPVVAATLTFDHPEISMSGENGDEAVDASETMGFFSVDRVSLDDLRELPGASSSNQELIDLCTEIFNDLGDGTGYGTLTASKSNNGRFQTIALNANALAAINSAIADGDGHFLIGGSLLSGRSPGNGLPRGVQERIFRGADDSGGAGFPEIKLTLSFGDQAPAPAPAPALGGIFGLSLLGTGLGGVGLAARRRKRKRS